MQNGGYGSKKKPHLLECCRRFGFMDDIIDSIFPSKLFFWEPNWTHLALAQLYNPQLQATSQGNCVFNMGTQGDSWDSLYSYSRVNMK